VLNKKKSLEKRINNLTCSKGSCLIRFFVSIVCSFYGYAVDAQPEYPLEGLDLSGDVATYFDEHLGLDNTLVTLGVYKENETVLGEGHPNFLSKYWQSGTIFYRGQQYQSLNLIYNVADDQLIIQHPNVKYSDQAILINQDQVEWFEIDGHYFRNYRDFNSPGFYEVIFSSDSFELLVKRQKVSSFKSSEIYFQSEDQYYLSRDTDLIPARKVSRFWKSDDRFKQELKIYVRENKIPSALKKCSIQELMAFSDYYNKLLLSKEVKGE